MLLEKIKPGWLDGKWTEIFAERRQALYILMEQGEIERLWQIDDSGTGVRQRNGDFFSYSYATSLKSDDIEKVIKITSNGTSNFVWNGVSTDYDCDIKIPFLSRDIKDKIDFVKRAEAKISEYGSKIAFRKIAYREEMREVEIYNSEGLHVYFQQPQVVFLVQVAVADPQKGIETGYEAIGRSSGLELFEEVSPEEIAIDAVERGLKSLNAEWVKAGRMPVVISSAAGGTIIHEAVGHGLEGDLVFNNLSVYSGKMGEKVASELVTIVDDATLPCARGSFPFDDEGTPSQRSVLIENGILKGYMTDLFYAEKLGIGKTGNGRRESYRFMPIVRMTNTFMLPGKDSVEDIISSVDEGLYVLKMGGGEVNTISGDFVFEVLEAHMIRKGKIAEPVRGATLIGNGPEILKKVEMVGNDLGFSVGTCGKDGQGVPVTDGMPTTKISEITVGGKVK